MTKITSGLPKEEAKNGLYSLGDKFVRDEAPDTMRLVVGLVDCKRVTVDRDSGDREALVRFLRIEEVAPEDADEAERLLRRAVRDRLTAGHSPAEIDESLAEVFVDGYWIDPQTGEIHSPATSGDGEPTLFSDVDRDDDDRGDGL